MHWRELQAIETSCTACSRWPRYCFRQRTPPASATMRAGFAVVGSHSLVDRLRSRAETGGKVVRAGAPGERLESPPETRLRTRSSVWLATHPANDNGNSCCCPVRSQSTSSSEREGMPSAVARCCEAAAAAKDRCSGSGMTVVGRSKPYFLGKECDAPAALIVTTVVRSFSNHLHVSRWAWVGLSCMLTPH